MGICVPKHIVCNWYTPNFTPSSESCTLKIDTENVARLEAGGTFFRSINGGTQTNNIQISCEWQVLSGTPPEWISWSGSLSTPFDGRVEVIVTNGGSPIEVYHAAQTVDLGSPETIGTSSAISEIRSKISGSPISSQLITMPEIDTQQPWNVGSPYIGSPLGEADYLDEFTLKISTFKFDSATRPVAKICEFLAKAYYSKEPNPLKKMLSAQHRERIIECAFDWMINDEKVAVKAYSMSTLYLFGKDYHRIHPELSQILEQDYPNQSCAFQARAKHILKNIKNKK